MEDHPIQGLMQTAMENIKEMVDVNTIVGDPVQTPDGSVIMPISKVGFGFVAGGSDIRFDDLLKLAMRCMQLYPCLLAEVAVAVYPLHRSHF